MNDAIVLHYIAEHGEFINGVPTRDLTMADLEAYGKTAAELLAYNRIYSPTPTQLRKPLIVIDPNDGIQDNEARDASTVLNQRKHEQE